MGKFSKTVLVVILMSAAPSCLKAQYLPFVEEGKVWTYYFDASAFNAECYHYSYYIQGDTVVEGRACKKVYYEQEDLANARLFGALYEEGGKVYFHTCNNTSHWYQLFDYTLGVGERICWATDCLDLFVGDIQTLEICGVSRRVYMVYELEPEDVPFAEGWYPPDTYWIEGIGSMQGLLYPFFAKGTGSFETCTTDESVVYARDAFFESLKTFYDSLETSVHAFVDDQCHPNEFYDLQGRRLTHEPVRGMYIRDGRKYLKR